MSANTEKTTDLMEQARRAVEIARKKGAAEVAAVTSRARDVDVYWRDGKVDRVSEATRRGLSLSLYVDGRYSAVSSSDLRPDALETFIADAIALARALAPDEHRRLPDPKLYEGRESLDLAILDPEQASLTADQRRAWAREAEEAARARDKAGQILSVTSNFGDTRSEWHRVTSNGFEGSQQSTTLWGSAEVSVKDADGRRPEEYDFGIARHLGDLPAPADVGARAVERTFARLGSTKGASAALPMVVENRAAGRLVSMLLGPMSGAAIQQKRSFLDGKEGQKIGSPKLTITDDPFVLRGLGSRLFDGDGIASRMLPVIEAGVLKTLYIDDYYGRKLGKPPTTGGASNLSWVEGDKAQDALVAAVQDGILVTGFLGGNSNGGTGDFSLGIKGFRITKGKVAEPIGEMNIAGNQLELWSKLAAVGNDSYPYSAMRTPTLVFDGVQFAGV
jgi:PmbA protein